MALSHLPEVGLFVPFSPPLALFPRPCCPQPQKGLTSALLCPAPRQDWVGRMQSTDSCD